MKKDLKVILEVEEEKIEGYGHECKECKGNDTVNSACHRDCFFCGCYKSCYL